MPATINHLETNFDRIERGVLDHKRVNEDTESAEALRKIAAKAEKIARKTVQDALKATGTKVNQADLTFEQIAQVQWDTTIAMAVEAGVQTSIPGTRGNEFRSAARKAEREVTDTESDEDEEPAEEVEDESPVDLEFTTDEPADEVSE